MANYSVVMARTASATLGIGGIQCAGSGMRRIKLYDVTVGSEATPADTGVLWRISRSTTAGTSSAATPVPLDPADAAAVSLGVQNFTVAPTVTSALMSIALNQRATYRWVAAPGSELVVPATANAGLITETPTLNGGTPAITSTQLFQEQ